MMPGVARLPRIWSHDQPERMKCSPVGHVTKSSEARVLFDVWQCVKGKGSNTRLERTPQSGASVLTYM